MADKPVFSWENPPTHEKINALPTATIKQIIEKAKTDYRWFIQFFCFTDDPQPRGDGQVRDEHGNVLVDYPKWIKNKPWP